MRGDILLYRTGGILKDRVVCAYTAGPFCHCEIDLGDGTTVGAHSEDGISRTKEHMLERRVVITLQEHASPERIEAGIASVMQRVGEPFSWASIADLILPARLSTMLFGRRSDFNCANLIAMYLDSVGALDLPPTQPPHQFASPNAIARAFGVLPPAAGWRHARLYRATVAIWALLPSRRIAPRPPKADEGSGQMGIASLARQRYSLRRGAKPAKAAKADRVER